LLSIAWAASASMSVAIIGMAAHLMDWLM